MPPLKTIWRFSIGIIFLGLVFYWLPSKIKGITVGEIITFLAVLVALFKDELHTFFIPPLLKISASTDSSHLHEAELKNQQTGAFVENQVWFSVIIENKGMGVAKNVELLFNAIGSNRIVDFNRFKGLPLRRSWTQEPLIRSLHRNTPVGFAICYIREPEPNLLSFYFVSTPNALLNINCPANKASSFDFVVVAVADNALPARKRVRVIYNGNYADRLKIELI